MKIAKRDAIVKKWIALGIITLMSLYPASAKAAAGNITIQLQEDTVSSVLYSRIATMVNGFWELEEEYKECDVDLNEIENAKELEEAAGKLLLYAQKNHINLGVSEKKGEDYRIRLENSEEGLYLFTAEETDEAAMLPTLAALPSWDGQEMIYDVMVFPKFMEKQTAPVTGWDSEESIYAGMAGIAFVIIMTLFCYKRYDSFK